MSGRRKHKVLILNRLPARLPLTLTIVWWLLLDRLNAAGWVWGATGTVIAVYWAGCIYALFVQQPTDLKELQDG